MNKYPPPLTLEQYQAHKSEQRVLRAMARKPPVEGRDFVTLPEDCSPPDENGEPLRVAPSGEPGPGVCINDVAVAIPQTPAPLPPAPAAIVAPSPVALPVSVSQDMLKTGVSTLELGVLLCALVGEKLLSVFFFSPSAIQPLLLTTSALCRSMVVGLVALLRSSFLLVRVQL